VHKYTLIKQQLLEGAMPWQEKGILKLRYDFVQRVYSGEKIAPLCREYGISRPTAYLWLKRYKESPGVDSLRNRSHRPHASPGKIDDALEERICQLREQYGWAGKKLQILLERENRTVGVATINRVIKRNGLLQEEDCHKPSLQRFERKHPNELWQMDFKGPMSRDDAKCEPLTVLDDHSRYALGVVPVRTKQTPDIQRAFIEIFSKYGVPEAILTDHGVPWWNTASVQGLSKFSVWLMNQDLKLIFGAVRHPQTQGKIERFHRTLRHAVSRRGFPTKFSQWKPLLKQITYEYNFIRPHESLEMKVPSELYCASSKKYNPKPRAFDYGDEMKVKKVDSHGMIYENGKRLFVSHALVGQYVATRSIENLMLVTFRNSTLREIDFNTTKTKRLEPFF